ncbi:unnamed protein product [Penicillium nalgiovense]|nr:unnamed protein product [Penicillium nalgiovense]
MSLCTQFQLISPPPAHISIIQNNLPIFPGFRFLSSSIFEMSRAQVQKQSPGGGCVVMKSPGGGCVVMKSPIPNGCVVTRTPGAECNIMKRSPGGGCVVMNPADY